MKFLVVFLVLLRAVSAYGGQPPQNKEVTILPKASYAAGTYTSPQVKVTGDWRVVNIQTLNTLAEWLAVSGTITISVYCSLDQGATFVLWQRTRWIGGMVGKYGQLPIAGLSFPNQNMPPLVCYGTFERSNPMFIGFKVTDVR